MKLSISNNAKTIIRNSHIWQKRCARKGFFSNDRYRTLPEFEKTNPRVCYIKRDILDQYTCLLDKINIYLIPGRRFQHWIDTGLYRYPTASITDTLPPDYSLIINNSIEDLIKKNSAKENYVQKSNARILIAIRNYINRIIKMTDEIIEKDNYSDKCLINTRVYFVNMLSKPAISLEESLQRILFWSSLFWQSGHRHVGLGRLDLILDSIQLPDSSTEIIEIISDFYKELHCYYEYKSAQLIGDTGQIIVLGGMQEDNSYFCNRLTYLFIEALKRLKLPDPKIAVRVSSKMPERLMDISLKTIATGIGSPLFSNDEIVINSLIEFGYEKKDAYNYVTSACWEPLIYGSGWGKGNLDDINFGEILVKTYEDNRYNLCENFDDIMDIFYEHTQTETKRAINSIDRIRWEKNPLMTLFTRGCIETGRDIGDGGCRYCDYGILTVGLANAIDSLFNIKYLVFEKHKYSLSELKVAAENNFLENKNIYNILKEESYFGKDDYEITDLTNSIMSKIVNICKEYKNIYGGRVKVGFSSPSYLSAGIHCGATLDGRLAGQPLATHISSSRGVPYTQLLNFSTMLDYSEYRHNGNVTDIILTPAFIENNFEKIKKVIKVSIRNCVYQLQMNVLSSEKLLDAKRHPEQYGGLIVRVWGFSAYFNDLPEAYKDIIIQRSLECEKVV